MNPIDLIVLLLVVFGLISGARAGFVSPVLGLIGAVAGFGLALLLSSVLREPLAQIDQPMRALVTVLGLAALILTGEAVGAAVGAQVSLGLRRSLFQPIDMLGGAVVGAAHVVLFVWLLGGMLALGFMPGVGSIARESVAVRVVNERLPPPITVAGRLLALLDTTDLPPLFGGLEPLPAEPVDLPDDAEARTLAESATASTARIAASGCGMGLSVGSGFFVSPTYVVTNAHVVAGSSATTVTVNGGSFDAFVVAFDDVADLALLNVPGADARALALASVPPDRGTTGVALGYPGGGDLTATAAGVTLTRTLPGPNIYGDGIHERTVVEMRTEIRRGNSGGPLVVGPGTVGAVVFGASRTASDVGYAIGVDEVHERIAPFIGSTTPVGTGACL